MSVVTNIMFTGLFDEEEDAIIAEHLNAFEDLRRKWSDISLENIAGDKTVECSIYVGAYNYLDLERFKQHLSKLHHILPEGPSLKDSQLFVKRQEDDKWRVLEFKEPQFINQ